MTAPAQILAGHNPTNRLWAWADRSVLPYHDGGTSPVTVDVA